MIAPMELEQLQRDFMRVAYPDVQWDRQHYIGGSDVAAIMGIHPYCTREQKLREKLGLEPPFVGNWASKLGQAMEPLILAEYAERTGRDLVVAPPPPEPPPDELKIIHPSRPYLRGSLDGWVESERIVVEAKLVGPAMAKKWGAEGSDKIPVEYVAQTALYMALKDADKAHVVGLLLGFGLSKTECRHYEVKRDLGFEDQMMKEVEAFWNELEERRSYVAAEK